MEEVAHNELIKETEHVIRESQKELEHIRRSNGLVRKNLEHERRSLEQLKDDLVRKDGHERLANRP